MCTTDRHYIQHPTSDNSINEWGCTQQFSCLREQKCYIYNYLQSDLGNIRDIMWYKIWWFSIFRRLRSLLTNSIPTNCTTRFLASRAWLEQGKFTRVK